MRFHGQLINSATMVLILACVVSLAAPSNANTIYVDANAPGLNLGTTWLYAYNYLQDALAVAQPGDTIKVAQGTYRPTDGVYAPQTEQDATFSLLTGVTIEGGYYGNPLTVTPPLTSDTRDPNLYVSILSGDLNDDDPIIDEVNDVNNWTILANLPNLVERQTNAHTVVTGYSNEPNAVLDGFTITGGIGGYGLDNSTDPWPYMGRRGAGLSLYQSHATISNCIFRQNTATMQGGALYAYNSDPNIVSCTFVNNYSDNHAGALYLHGADALIQDCNFAYNAVKSSRYGGAAYCQSSDANFVDCLFTGNYGGSQSGAVHNNESSPEFYNCQFLGNKVSSYGGAVRNGRSSWPYFENCMFMDNISNKNGGAVDNYYSNPTFVNCIFTKNRATKDGGAIANQSAEVVMANCLLNRNISLQYGGGISSIDTLLTVVNNTFYYNSATDEGPAIACLNFGSNLYPSDVYVANSILWNGGNEIYNANSSIVDVNYSNVQDGWAGVGNIYAWPRFQDPDGPDGIPGTADDDLSLKALSPCIDAGDNLEVPLEILTDLAGNSRFMDDPNTIDTGNGTAPIVDMGAYEYPGEGGISEDPVANAGTDQTVEVASGGTALVTLDGSGSYDPQGQGLFYFWTWTDGEGSLCSATGMSPTISLTEGDYVIQLVVHNGTTVSQPDTVNISVVEEDDDFTIEVSFLPSIIDRNNVTSDYFLATVKVTGIDESDLNLSAGMWLVPQGVQSILALANSDSSGTTITAFFSMTEVLNAVTTNGNISLTVLGTTNSGGTYSGVGTVFIYN